MDLPTGERFELLSPFDPRQERGKPARIYPLHLMQPGDWFVVEDCPPRREAAIRASIFNFRKGINRDRRFTVRNWPDCGPAAVICVRTA